MKTLLKSFARRLGFEVFRAARPGEVNVHSPFYIQRRLAQLAGHLAPTILDVGANHGSTATTYRQLFPDSAIYAFEPFPATFQRLEQSLAGDARFHPVCAAVADAAGRKKFYVNEFDATNSLLPRPESSKRYYPSDAGPKGVTEVNVVTLDQFTAEGVIGGPLILKMDVQGGELAALRGAERILASGQVLLVYVEVMFVPLYEEAALFHEIWSYLIEQGFSLFDISDLHRARDGQLRYGDAIFVSKAVREILNSVEPEP